MPTNESYQEREEHTHTQKNKVGKACQYRCSEHLLKPLHQMAYDQWESGEKGPFHPAPFHPWNSQTYICLHTKKSIRNTCSVLNVNNYSRENYNKTEK